MKENISQHWQAYWKSLDWNHFVAVALNKGLTLLLMSLCFFFLYRFGSLLIKKSFEKYDQSTNFETSRIKTLERLSLNIFHYTIFFFVCYSILSLFGIPVGSLIAGAGIAGVAIGLGAQGFINDILTGFFIILERQIEVGDEVTINNINGIVKSVGLRTTQIKSFDGTLNYIPNRTITIICNASREERRVKIDLYVKPTIDIPKALSVLEEVSLQHQTDPDLIGHPQVLGFVPLEQGQFALRIHLFTVNGAQDRIEREWTTYYVEALQKAGLPPLTVVFPLPKDNRVKGPIIANTSNTASSSLKSFTNNNSN